jgi:colanic acid/amylovoran biosynthesis protein
MLRLCLFGAPDDTGNLGVSALLRGTLAGIAGHRPDAEVTVFDHGRGAGSATVALGGRTITYQRVGAPWTRRHHRPEAFTRLAAGALTALPIHPGSLAVRNADAVLVIAGGDSFADLYGSRRMRSAVAPMRLARALGRPLVLLPQTYGPFSTARSRQLAARLVSGATMAWARDRRGHEAVVALTGPAYDPSRHRLGIDVAHGLPVAAHDDVARAYGPSPTDGEQVAINVSGLLTSSRGPLAGTPAADHRVALERLGRHVLDSDPSARVVLVPHVLGSRGESDVPACRALAAALGSRAVAAPPVADPSVVKGLIARSSWFCGARMHATIAALSSGVPAAAVAYSDKFAGTFGDLGRGDHVADARIADAAELARLLIGSYEQRHDDRGAARRAASHAQVRASGQMGDLLDVVAGSALVGV